ncbi:Anaphase-promoting complex subunit 10 [Coemansia spiralis]|uniref:Anaphase-promoting complex subunit 10 n=2 Tax=Coemansia TaxID=4863 RepID=A0A9W8FYW4_9FUNG|nr:Anaphase-promoting complex subunit 10 [Coemansia umbellata]KAJ2619729.1 Anaphase-promoting complex subunit 10 [Coemansia sp. RSA 1358]KAJ2672026.1 Anaphase-promoting complex subunit 10 [Coemansia spiralis]
MATDYSKLPNISAQGTWTVSSTKHGFGIENLHDGNVETFWQSDGHQPHSISVQFPKRHQIHAVSLYLDIDKDESYTPCRVAICAGTNQYDKQLVKDEVFTNEPRGWVDFRLTDIDGPMLMAHFLHIEIPLNYENGKDVRVRMVRVLGPPPSEEKFRREHILPYTSQEFYMYESLR